MPSPSLSNNSPIKELIAGAARPVPRDFREPCLPCLRLGKMISVGTPSQDLQKASPVGILNVDKPRGLTSHDVVARIRKAARVRRVGHAGTLDPMATGVLLVLLGSATRLSQFLRDSLKTYRAQVYLGRATDTNDTEGRVIAEKELGNLSPSDIENALISFRGRIQQVPPVYSALKKEGQPLYRRARRGEEVELAPREVEIYRLEILGWRPPTLELEIECSSGTYVRALARDLGEKLGCGAHLAGLVRTRSGRFPLEEAVSLADIEAAFANGSWSQYLHRPDEALLDLEPAVLDHEAEKRVRHGQAVSMEGSVTGKMVRAYSPSGQFIAILVQQEDGRWHPDKVFV